MDRGKTEAQPALVPESSTRSQPSKAFAPLKVHSAIVKVAFGPSPAFLYAQPSNVSQAVPSPSTPASPKESDTAPFLIIILRHFHYD